MKLFKSLLVAPATLGLLAPLAATANEVTISDFTPAEQLAVTNSRVDGLEARLNNIEAGSFSETTTASFSADMVIGTEDGVAGNEALTAGYSFQIDLSTSFTGEDSLDVSIDAGNSDDGNLDEFGLNDSGDGLQVDGVAYTFPVGEKTTVFVGDNMDGSTLFSTACVYGGPSDTLDDCGNANSGLAAGHGTAAGASFDLGNGFTAAVGYEGTGDSTNGLFTNEGQDAYAAQLTYVDDSYGVSVTYGNLETTAESAPFGYLDTTYWALNGYWTPSETGSMPSISVGYETGDPEQAGAEDTTHYFVGLQWDEFGPGTFGVALGTKAHVADNADEEMMYEAFYSYPVNDGMTITPLVYVKENVAAGVDDQTGIMVKTSFSF